MDASIVDHKFLWSDFPIVRIRRYFKNLKFGLSLLLQNGSAGESGNYIRMIIGYHL